MIEIIRGSGGGGGKGGGGSGGGTATETPNSLQSDAILNIVEALSEGPIVGLVNGAQSIFFNDTPVQNADGTYNFNNANVGSIGDSPAPNSGIAYDFRYGYPDQDYFHNAADVEDEVSVGVKIFQATPLVRTIDDDGTNSVRITLETPALTSQDPSTGDISGNSVGFLIEYQASNTGWITVTSDSFSGTTTAAYQRSYTFGLSGIFPWNIRVTRLTPDNTLANQANDLYWSSYTRIINSTLIYPDTALINMVINSQFFGSSVPVRAYLIQGMIIDVPTNYNPSTGTYTGVWDGTFQKAYSNNPAWVLYDLITNPRYGLGQYIDADQVDKYALYTIAQYCDGPVPDGFGGYERRFTFNYAITSQDKALKVLQYVSSCFRGMLYWGSIGTSGTITPVCDMPKDPVKIFSNANVISGLFTYSGTALEARHSAVWVTWNNPDINYKTDIEVYEDSNLIQLYTYRKLDVTAFGCTSRGQARRYGKWVLETEQNESETVVFSVGIADADVRPGDIVNILDSDFANIRYGGRVVSGTTTSIVVDSAIVIDSESFSVTVTMPDGSLASATISNSAGTYTMLNLSSPLPQAPNQWAMFAITSTNVNPRQFRVIGVKETNLAEFEVTAMLYYAGKFEAVEENINIAPLSFTAYPTGVMGAPGGITYQPYFRRQGVVVTSCILVSWQASPDARTTRYGLEVASPQGNGSWALAAETNGLSYVLTNVSDGTWGFRVRGFDAVGNASPYSVLINQGITINSTPPADVQNFTISVNGDNSILSWDPVTSINLDHYEIRYSSATTGALWENSTTVTNQAASQSTSVTVGSRTGSFLIKSVSVPTANYPAGIYSADATIIETDVDALINFTFIIQDQEDPTFGGLYTNTYKTGSGTVELELINPTTVQSSGEYVPATYMDLGQVFTFRLTPSITAAGDQITNDVDNWANVDLIADVDGTVDGQWELSCLVSTTQDDPNEFILLEDSTFLRPESSNDRFWLETAVAVWTDFNQVIVGNYVARGIQSKLEFTSLFSSVTPSVSTFGLRVDMPNLIQDANDIAVPSGGYTVVFAQQFQNNTPSIAISAQNMQTGDYYTKSGVSSTGFTINFYNAAGTGISRTFDYIAKGYGYVS